MKNTRKRVIGNDKRSINNANNNLRRGTRSGNPRSTSIRNTNRDNRDKTSIRKSHINRSTFTVVALILVVGIVAVGLITWSNLSYLYKEDIIIPGVEVENIDISGLTRDEAYATLNNRLNEKIEQLSINLYYEDKTWTYDASALNASGDLWAIIDQALLLGHTGNLRHRMAEAEYVLNNIEQFNISFGYDENLLKSIVENLKFEIDYEAVEPLLEFDKDAGKITGIEDRTALLYNPLKYDTSVFVNGAPADIYIDASGNHKVNADIFKTTPGKTGISLNVDATVSAIILDLADDSIANVNIVVNSIEPTLKEEDLFEYTSLVYHSKSSIDSSSSYERDQNVDIALSKFDGMVIMPGDIVSFNETTGERLPENGFLLAPGIASDKSLQLVYGGGVCQAATIIFNAALMAGFEILDKDSHSWPLYYQEDDFGTEARDAMVNWGTSDLVFKNTTDYPVYFDTYVYWKYPDNATHAYCNVYTKLLPDGQSIKYEPVLMDTKEAPEAEIVALVDETEYADKTWSEDQETGLLVYKHILSRPYKYYEVNQQIVDAHGNIISEQLWYKSQYNEIKGLYYTKPNIVDNEVN